ncbi:MAG TPA: bifunctional diaminohydroxyphosphoribosylaminopyrimidine deaminase/5-amino-6-(5-phosphoribosylamino)uracil reductase RibD [Candidatus Nanopelagicaceae bacterium]|nr:bifunctional diaminohydroxyphosphoribosylaminopyrimidine deaminase/5-amino-6-(5-phosphoribosylamino)uracil reductase RibD [Candidatus Nanopelagicaceae bacterium]
MAGAADNEPDPMRRALSLAARADFATSPNPMVGAVVVNGGEVVGEGFHHRAGQPHAEVIALEQAGPRARGAELWVSLEPCCTTGRTGPCTRRVIDAGVVRVHVAVVDPNPAVRGAGLEELRRAGIEVVVGERSEEAARLIEFYSVWVRTGLPFLTLKLASSLDGKVATAGGDSQWITSAEARADGHRLRHAHDAIMVGIGTAIADDPELSARPELEHPRQPLRVVLDSRLRLDPGARLLRTGKAKVVVATLTGADGERRRRLETAGAEVVELPADGAGRVPLRELLGRLGGRGIISVLVEGGPTLLGALQAAGLGDRVVAYLAPIIIGGAGAPGPFGGDGVARLEKAWRWHWTEAAKVGPDLRLTAEV